MNHTLEVVYAWTDDDYRLQGMHYQPKGKKDIAVIFIHGMAGNFISSVHADVLGKLLTKNGIGYIYGHNRGYSQMNDIPKGKPNPDGGYHYSRHGAAFEKFSNCYHDINAWIDEALKHKYQRLVLIGHSLGGPKVIYSYPKLKHPSKTVGIALASPADNVGLTIKYFGNQQFQQLVQEAEENVSNGNLDRFLSKKVDDYYFISSHTFLESMVPGCSADVFPVFANPEKWPHLADIDKPILCFYGDDDIANVNRAKEDLDLIESKASNYPSFTKKIIKGANHIYENNETEFAKVVLDWIRKLDG